MTNIDLKDKERRTDETFFGKDNMLYVNRITVIVFSN